MARIIRTGLAVLAMSAFVVPAVLGQDRTATATGKNGEVELRREARVASLRLPPGHYRFQHQVSDGQHYLVVYAREMVRNPSNHYAGVVRGEVARVLCTRVPSATGGSSTVFYTSTEADGTLTVTRIDIKGEKEGHVIAVVPQS